MELLLELRINSGRLQPLLALAYRKRALACRYGAHSAALLQAGDPCLVAFVPAISRLGSSLGGRAERLQARAALLWRQLEQQARRLLNFASVANGVAQELEAEGLAARVR